MAAALSLAACAPADTPPSLSDPLPAEAVALLHPDTVRTQRLAAGLWYRFVWSSAGPWAVHVVEADLTRCDLSLRVLRAQPRESGGRGLEAVSSMVARSTGGVVAAVNADFFTPEGSALGTEIVDGRVTAARERPVLAWRPGRAPWIGRVRVTGDSLKMGWGVALDSGDGTTEAVSGFPELLENGRLPADLTSSERPSFGRTRHPRTAVGYDPRTGRLLLVVVDGRQAPYSAGMTLPELSRLMRTLGASEALNLDGGSSSAMVVRGRLASHPSDPEGERPVANALAVVRNGWSCRRARAGVSQPPQLTPNPTVQLRPGPGSK